MSGKETNRKILEKRMKGKKYENTKNRGKKEETKVEKKGKESEKN